MYQLLFLLSGLLTLLDPHENKNPVGNNPDLINDGPYIYQVNNKLKVGWIENSVYSEDIISPDNFNALGMDFNLSFNYKDLTDTYLLKPDYNQIYTNADSIGVISDIHGQYSIYIDLLRETGIIDEKLNWNFGKGHLVVLGDMFDRGNMVTEVLWHLFGLEKQAEKAGGRVHVLLGNHEFMVLRNDLCSINEKYWKVEEISKTGYADLYSDKSVLGKWLRSKPVVITIDNIIFVHGGISTEMIHRNLHFKQINRFFTNNIIGKNQWVVYEDELLKFLNEANGPLWYRGYFYDTDFCESEIDSILDFYRKKHIVVGHTPNETITSLFDNKILGADTGIGHNKPGEILIYKDGSFYQCFNTNCRVKL
jgi:hypothetical protein